MGIFSTPKRLKHRIDDGHWEAAGLRGLSVVSRLPVLGGWLVAFGGATSVSAATFVPDPDRVWLSDPQQKA